MASDQDSMGFISEVNGQCQPSGHTDHSWIFPTLLLIWHGVVLIYANMLVYETRNLHKLSDSKHVAIAVFNSLQLLIVAISLIFGGKSQDASYMIRVFFVFLNNSCVLFLVVLRKIYACLIGQGDKLPNIHDMRAKDRRSRDFQSVLRGEISSMPGSGGLDCGVDISHPKEVKREHNDKEDCEPRRTLTG